MGALPLEKERQGREIDHSLPSSARLIIGGVLSPLTHTTSKGCVFYLTQGQIYLYLYLTDSDAFRFQTEQNFSRHIKQLIADIYRLAENNTSHTFVLNE
jgi:hypothetical protein